MAWRRYRRRFRSYGRRFRSYGRRGMQNKWITFGAGAAAGFMAPKVIPYQDEIALVITAAPVRIPRAVRSVASGYVIGRIAKNLMGGGLTGSGSGTSSWY